MTRRKPRKKQTVLQLLNEITDDLSQLHGEVTALPRPPQAREVKGEAFAAYRRRVEVTPNGHANARVRVSTVRPL